MTTSSRSTSVKSSKAASGHDVELGSAHHGNGYGSPASTGIAPPVGGGGASAASAAAAVAAKDDRRDKVGQDISEDEDEDASERETPANAGPENVRAGYQAF